MGTVEGRKKIVRVTNGIRPREYAATRLTDLLDFDACFKEMQQKLHPGGLHCLNCGGLRRHSHGKSRHGLPRYKCLECGKIYTITTGTPFSGTSMGPKQLVLFMRMWGSGMTPRQMAGELRMHPTSIRVLQKNLQLQAKYNGAH